MGGGIRGWLLLMQAAVAWPAAAAAQETLSAELLPPVQVMAGEAPLDVGRIGHAAPFTGDFDGDGMFDLFVGEFFEGRMRIFRNQGAAGAPRFESFEWFRAGADLGRVPTG